MRSLKTYTHRLAAQLDGMFDNGLITSLLAAIALSEHGNEERLQRGPLCAVPHEKALSQGERKHERMRDREKEYREKREEGEREREQTKSR